MTDEAKVKELAKNRRVSLLNLRRGLVLFGVTAVGLIILQQFVKTLIWLPFVVLGILSFTLIGDAFNYFYCGRQIRKIEEDRRE